MTKKPDPAALHPIQVAVRRAGISADVLRAWEKRYATVTPRRTETGRRLYSDADIERLRLIKQAMIGGRRIGDVAALSTADLARLVEEDREEAHADPTPPGATAGAVDFLASALEAVRRADQAALRAGLSRALLQLAPARFIDEVATPFMHRMGDMWERGEVTPGHEHAASEVMRQLLTEVLGMLHPETGARTLVVATPSGQRHELGALLAATTAALEGWRVTYLGPDLPTTAIARVALDTQATAVALSVTAADAELPAQLKALRRAVGKELPIFVGGQQASRLDGAQRHAMTIPSLDAFRSALTSLPI